MLAPQPPESARRAIATNLDVIDLDTLADASEYVSVRQLIVPPFSVVKLDFGTIHRGIGNTGDFERIMFWISVSRNRAHLPVEPTIEAIRGGRVVR